MSVLITIVSTQRSEFKENLSSSISATDGQATIDPTGNLGTFTLLVFYLWRLLN